MKKFAANYLVSEKGTLLKNGIVVLTDDGKVAEIIDTKGDLHEIAQLTFLNGILIPNFWFRKDLPPSHQKKDEFPVHSSVNKIVKESSEIGLSQWIEKCVQIQKQFPDMIVPEIFAAINADLQTGQGYYIQHIPGLYLLKGIDLVNLHFSSGSKIKKVL